MFINPCDTVLQFAKQAAAMGASKSFDKLREHFHLTDNDLKSYKTTKNMVYAAMAAGGIAAILANPVTRVALFTFLGMSYSMTMGLVSLMILGIQLTMMAANGASSAVKTGVDVATKVASTMSNQGATAAKEATETLKQQSSSTTETPQKTTEAETKVNSEQNTPSKPSDTTSKNPLENVKSEELIEEFLQEQQTSNTTVENPLENVTTEELTDQFLEESNQVQEIEQQTIPPTKDLGLEPSYDDLWDEFSSSLPTEETLDKAWKETDQSQISMNTTHASKTSIPLPKNLEKTFDDVWQQTGKGLPAPTFSVKDLEAFSKSSQLLTQNKVTEEWVQDFAMQQVASGSKLATAGKLAVGVTAVGFGVFALYKTYQWVKEMNKEQEEAYEEVELKPTNTEKGLNEIQDNSPIFEPTFFGY